MAEKEENHKRHGEDGEDGGDSDELRGFDVVSVIFSGEKSERSGGRESLDERADIYYFDREV